MTPAEATAEALVRAANRSATELHSVVRDVPLSAVQTVLKALAWRVTDLLDRLEAAPTLVDWAPGDARKAHARYARGLRDPWTVTGERSYQREKKRRYRVAELRLSASVDRTAPSDHHDERRAG